MNDNGFEIVVTPVAETEPAEFSVTVLVDDMVRTEHLVRVPVDEAADFGLEARPEELVEALFHFLLDRETPEMILESFSVGEVRKHFPNVDDTLEGYL